MRTFPKRTSVGMVFLVGGLASSVASSQMLNDQGPPLHRLVHRNTLAVRVNPLGLIYDGRLAYRLRLYQSESKALRDNFLGIGIAPMLSPAWGRIGPFVEFNPLSVFGLWAMFHYVQYFGTVDLAQGFAGAESDFSDRTIKANTKMNSRATNGWELTLGANLQLKLAFLVIKAGARLVHGSLKLREGERVYYDLTYDIAAPNNGWTFVNDLDVLWQGLGNKLVAGARYTVTVPLYDPARHFADPTAAVDNSMHRLGPFLAYTFKFEDGARFNTPTAFLAAQWWLKHRFRAGQEISQAIPVVVVGFQITGDFLPFK